MRAEQRAYYITVRSNISSQPLLDLTRTHQNQRRSDSLNKTRNVTGLGHGSFENVSVTVPARKNWSKWSQGRLARTTESPNHPPRSGLPCGPRRQFSQPKNLARAPRLGHRPPSSCASPTSRGVGELRPPGGAGSGDARPLGSRACGAPGSSRPAGTHRGDDPGDGPDRPAPRDSGLSSLGAGNRSMGSSWRITRPPRSTTTPSCSRTGFRRRRRGRQPCSGSTLGRSPADLERRSLRAGWVKSFGAARRSHGLGSRTLARSSACLPARSSA